MNNALERPSSGAMAPVLAEMPPASALPQAIGAAPAAAGDAVSVFGPPQTPDVLGGSGLMGIVSQLMSVLQQLLTSFGMGGARMPGASDYFTSAGASSTGDPHLAFNGTQAGGDTEQAHFDSMQSHADLLHSNSFTGGYSISTQVTQPSANGVTYNREASISTNFGQTQVSLDNAGNAAISSGGQTFSIANGQTIDLGSGESVTRNADGSLAVTDSNGVGGSITTRLSENGAGVDVNVQAQNVRLGGDITGQRRRPVMQPLSPQP